MELVLKIILMCTKILDMARFMVVVVVVVMSLWLWLSYGHPNKLSATMNHLGSSISL